jgi:hypothetical protein
MKTIQSRPGQTVERDDDGNLFVTMPTIRSVGIADLAQVQSHHVTHIAGSTSHVVHFTGGGLLRFAYSERGELIELSGRHVRGLLSAEHEVVFSAAV